MIEQWFLIKLPQVVVLTFMCFLKEFWLLRQNHIFDPFERPYADAIFRYKFIREEYVYKQSLCQPIDLLLFFTTNLWRNDHGGVDQSCCRRVIRRTIRSSKFLHTIGDIKVSTDKAPFCSS